MTAYEMRLLCAAVAARVEHQHRSRPAEATTTTGAYELGAFEAARIIREEILEIPVPETAVKP